MNNKKEKEKAKQLRKSRWWQNLISQKPRCYYCEKVMEKSEVTMDHIVPISRGGKSTRGNVVPCCKPCNTKKRDQTAVDMIKV